MTHQAAVLIDFENLVTGAEDSLPGNVDPVPYAAIELVCRNYGNAAVRRAYADWAQVRFNRHQESLALNGVELIHATRFGVRHQNVADIRLVIDAMELIFTRPDVGVFILVVGGGDYTPLVQRLREFGKQVVGVGTEASTCHRLVPICSEYRYWPTLVAQIDPRARTAVAAEFDIDEAERLLVSAVRQSNQPVLAAILRGKMLALDPSFDERNYGCKSFHDFLGRMSHIVNTEQKTYDLVVALPNADPTGDIYASVQATVTQEQAEPRVPPLLTELRALSADLPLRPETRDTLLTGVYDAWRDRRIGRVSDIGDVLLDPQARHLPNKNTRLPLERALTYDDAAPIPLAEQPVANLKPLRQCRVVPYDGSSRADWARRAHAAWLAWIMYRLKHRDDLDQAMVSTFFADSASSGSKLVAVARELLNYHCQENP